MPSEKTSQPGMAWTIMSIMVVLAAVNNLITYELSLGRTYRILFFVASLVAGLLLIALLRARLAKLTVETRPSPPQPAQVKAPPPKPPSTAAVHMLSILQQDGRLIDFLQEKIDSYSDAQIGAAVRAIHEGCRKAIAEHVALEPVLSGPEGGEVVVPEGFDPSAVRLTGNVTGKPPFRGILRHHGWRAAKVTLPDQAAGQNPAIVAPAEVEIP